MVIPRIRRSERGEFGKHTGPVRELPAQSIHSSEGAATIHTGMCRRYAQQYHRRTVSRRRRPTGPRRGLHDRRDTAPVRGTGRADSYQMGETQDPEFHTGATTARDSGLVYLGGPLLHGIRCHGETEHCTRTDDGAATSSRMLAWENRKDEQRRASQSVLGYIHWTEARSFQIQRPNVHSRITTQRPCMPTSNTWRHR